MTLDLLSKRTCEVASFFIVVEALAGLPFFTDESLVELLPLLFIEFVTRLMTLNDREAKLTVCIVS